MKEIKLTETFKRKRKMLLVLPVLVLPFISLAFWALGGGKGTVAATGPSPEGLNLQLPDARLKDDQHLDKMSYYKKAVADSVKKEEQIRKDPYYKIRDAEPDTTEVKIYERLAELDREMNTKNEMTANQDFESYINDDPLQPVSPRKTADDPELQQLDGMLDKILAIQNPDALPEQKRMESIKEKERAIPVSADRSFNNISLLTRETVSHSAIDTGFFAIDDSAPADISNAIEAVVHETRTIVNGSVLKIRLLTDIYLDGILIPKGNFVFGKTSLSGERLGIEISSIRYGKSVFPVSLTVYDLDGMDGLFIPGAITREVSKESSDRLMQGLALNSLNPSVASQAASAGLEAAKSLLTKKVKLVRVTVKAGYKIFLKSDK